MSYDEEAFDVEVKTKAKIAETKARVKVEKTKLQAKAKLAEIKTRAKVQKAKVQTKAEMLKAKVEGKILKGYVAGKLAQAQLKTKDAYEEVKKGVKKAFRKAEDETCDITDGKIQCGVKKIKHKIKNTVNEIEE